MHFYKIYKGVVILTSVSSLQGNVIVCAKTFCLFICFVFFVVVCIGLWIVTSSQLSYHHVRFICYVTQTEHTPVCVKAL